jgi:hypothetical protein
MFCEPIHNICFLEANGVAQHGTALAARVPPDALPIDREVDPDNVVYLKIPVNPVRLYLRRHVS